MAALVVAVVGAYVGGTVISGAILTAAGALTFGAQVGWAVGGMIGSSFGPAQKSQGPRLNDLSMSSSAYGMPIPYIQGAPRIAGQIVWASTKREVATTTRHGGKGGRKQKVTTYTYEVDLLILLTDNTIAGVSRIWSNGKLIWNKLASADAATIAASDATAAWTAIRIYNGAAAQLPDTTYEAAVGTANAPAYRGRGSVFIQGLQLGNSGQIPNLTFEIGDTVPVPVAGTDTTSIYAAAGFTGITRLSDTKSIAVFRDAVVPNIRAMVVNNPSGNTITLGSAVQVQATNSVFGNVQGISATKAIAAWANNSGGLNAYVAILNVATNTVSVVTPVLFTTGVSVLKVHAMSATQAMVVWGNSSAMVLDISGADLITTNAVFNTGMPTSGVSGLSSCKLDATRVLVTWRASVGGVLRAVVLTMSGGSITAGAINDVLSGYNSSNTNIGSVALSATSAIMLYIDPADNFHYMTKLSVSGDVVTGSAGVAVAPYLIATPYLEAISATHALCVFCKNTGGALCVTVVSGTTAGAIVELDPSNNSNASIAFLATGHTACVFIDVAGAVLHATAPTLA